MTAAAAVDPRPQETAAAVRATHAVFACLGLAGATWASRLPQIRIRLGLDPASLGLLLLMIAIGGVMALPPAGAVVTRLGPRRTVTAVAVLAAISLGAAALGFSVWAPLLVAGLFLLGAATGLWDVAITVHAAAVERRLGRSIMPRFFAGFSLGTVTGAAFGALMVTCRVPVSVHIAGIAVVVAVVAPSAARHFLSESVPRTAGSSHLKSPRTAARAWRETRTVRLGVVALAFAVVEGAGSNWISLSVIDRHHTTAALGTLAYSAFLAALTIGRWLGPAIVDRLGPSGALRAAAAVAAVGIIVFALGPNVTAAFAGALLWGMGAALGFPVSLSTGADEPARTAGRVGVITSIGYCGFVGGPPVIGFLGSRSTVAHALLAGAVLMAVSIALAGAARPRGPASRRPARTAARVVPAPATPPGEPHAGQHAPARDQ